MTTTLQEQIGDPQQSVTLYGSTPPRAGVSPEACSRAAMRLTENVRDLGLDGLVVYDVQDEHERTDVPRPFPYQPTIDPRIYAQLLQEYTGLATITYKSVGTFSEPTWLNWLEEAHQGFGLGLLALVGAATPNPPPDALSADLAMQLARTHAPHVVLGGVVIAERHSPAYRESQRLIAKAAQGCRFFISQVVYDPAPTARLLADYAQDCRQQGVSPQRIILTFSPCGRPATMTFLKWLGVAVPPETEQAILGDRAPFAKSIQICCANLAILADIAATEGIPLGINIESVSIHKEELAASVELVQALRTVTVPR
ncbi:MAG: hypothetical protein WCF99_18335 [Chloroflexales bacterium]